MQVEREKRRLDVRLGRVGIRARRRRAGRAQQVVHHPRRESPRLELAVDGVRLAVRARVRRREETPRDGIARRRRRGDSLRVHLRAVVFLVAEHQRRERAERGDVPLVQHERLLERLLGFAPSPPARQKRAVVRPNLGLVARDEQTLLVPLIRRVVLVVNLVLVRQSFALRETLAIDGIDEGDSRGLPRGAERAQRRVHLLHEVHVQFVVFFPRALATLEKTFLDDPLRRLLETLLQVVVLAAAVEFEDERLAPGVLTLRVAGLAGEHRRVLLRQRRRRREHLGSIPLRGFVFGHVRLHGLAVREEIRHGHLRRRRRTPLGHQRIGHRHREIERRGTLRRRPRHRPGRNRLLRHRLPRVRARGLGKAREIAVRGRVKRRGRLDDDATRVQQTVHRGGARCVVVGVHGSLAPLSGVQ